MAIHSAFPSAVLVVASCTVVLSAAASQDESPSLRELARQNGGKYHDVIHVDSAIATLDQLVAQSDVVARGRIAAETAAFNKTETVVRSVFTLTPILILKDRVGLGVAPSPKPTAALIFFSPGGTLRTDGLEITTSYSNAIDPPLHVGDEIIGFFVKEPGEEALRLHHGPYGVLRVQGDKVSSGNRDVARYRPLQHDGLAQVQAELQRLIAEAK